MSKAIGSLGQIISDDEIFLTDRQIGIILERAERSRELLGGLVLSLMKWIVASLLAINSGGAVAVLNLRSIGNSSLFLAEACFIIGLILALLCAFVTMYVMIGFLPDQGGLLMLEPGIIKKAKLLEIAEGKPARTGLRDPLLWLGWSSAIAFLLGTVVSALSLASI